MFHRVEFREHVRPKSEGKERFFGTGQEHCPGTEHAAGRSGTERAAAGRCYRLADTTEAGYNQERRAAGRLHGWRPGTSDANRQFSAGASDAGLGNAATDLAETRRSDDAK